MIKCVHCNKKNNAWLQLSITFKDDRNINGEICQACVKSFEDKGQLILEERMICLIKNEYKLPNLDNEQFLPMLPKELNKLILDYMRHDISWFTIMNQETYKQIFSILYRSIRCSLVCVRVTPTNGEYIQLEELVESLEQDKEEVYNLWDKMLPRYLSIDDKKVDDFKAALDEKFKIGTYIIHGRSYFEPCCDIFSEVEEYKSEIQSLEDKVRELKTKLKARTESDDLTFANWVIVPPKPTIASTSSVALSSTTRKRKIDDNADDNNNEDNNNKI